MPHIDQVDDSMADLHSIPNLQEETDRLLQHSTDTPHIHDDDNANPPPETESHSHTRSDSKDLQFVSTHFKDSSFEDEPPVKEEDGDDDEEAKLAAGLDLPDFDESARTEEQDARATQEATATAFLQAAFQNSQVVTDTVGGIMSSTIAGLSQLRESVMPSTSASSGSASVPHQSLPTMEEAAVDAEFEFLNPDDLADSLEEEKHN